MTQRRACHSCVHTVGSPVDKSRDDRSSRPPITDRLARARVWDPSCSGAKAPRDAIGGARKKGAPPGCKGNPPLVVSDQMRKRVRALAKVFPVYSQHHIAAMLGMSKSSLHKHFSGDLLLGRAEMVSALGARMIDFALNGDAANLSKGRPITRAEVQLMKFVLVRYGGW